MVIIINLIIHPEIRMSRGKFYRLLTKKLFVIPGQVIALIDNQAVF